MLDHVNDTIYKIFGFGNNSSYQKLFEVQILLDDSSLTILSLSSYNDFAIRLKTSGTLCESFVDVSINSILYFSAFSYQINALVTFPSS